MIRQVDFDSWRGGELIPQAIVRKPVSYFADSFGFRFVEDCDELDFFEGALLILDNRQPFALLHYRGHPEGTTTIYLPSDVADVQEISIVVGQIGEALHIDPSSVLWDRPSRGFEPPVANEGGPDRAF